MNPAHDSAFRRRKTFRPQTSFENTDWLITPHDRVGLVGANGTGKSTLMKVLAGSIFDYGSPIIAKEQPQGICPRMGFRFPAAPCLRNA